MANSSTPGHSYYDLPEVYHDSTANLPEVVPVDGSYKHIVIPDATLSETRHAPNADGSVEKSKQRICGLKRKLLFILHHKVIDKKKKNAQSSQIMDEIVSTITGSSSFLRETYHGQDAADDYETTLYHAVHLPPFLTRKNYLGLGSKSLAHGDSI
ncbi:hypothetical protein B0J13DRAFT_629125 [Dactylonectria estremocensis]|uniref:Uncharacterized protein n=1 Tax=Dactylonectria estremocensis TaxID=1079267 RepID=A0A9P9DJA4_9HYPO|nr:hypothetical protein B0J13DRAFT_629125 [Dactylonectria estremocensis]